MKGLHSSLYLSFVLLTAFVCLSYQTENITSTLDICRLFKDGTILRKPGICNEWIKCKKFKSIDSGICVQRKNFKLSTKKCGSLNSWDKYCKTKPKVCKKNTMGYVSNPMNCRGWYFCRRTTSVSYGLCPSHLHFDQKKQMCVYPEQMSTACNAKYELCNIVPPSVKFKNERNCSTYLTCVHGKVKVHECATDKYYDASSGKCKKKYLVECTKTRYPEEKCGTAKLAFRNRFVSDGATCRGYYYCHDLGSGKPDPNPGWSQCELDYFFDEKRQRCNHRENSKCAEERCEGRISGREISEIKGCQHFFSCKNGVKAGVFKCEDNKYFDIHKQICVREKRTYGACA